MKIAIDGGSLCPPDLRLKLGTYRVALGFLKGLTEIDHKNKYLIYTFGMPDEEVKGVLGENFILKILKPSLLWLKVRASLELLKDRPDVFLAFSQALPYYKNCPAIGFIHGLAFKAYPKYYPDSAEYLEMITSDLIKRCEHIVVSSERVKFDIAKFYNRRKNIHIIPFGVEKYFFSSRSPDEGRLPYKDNYILYVGAFNRIKNIPLLLKAFNIVRRNGAENLKLYLAGSDFWFDPKIEKTITKLKISPYIKNFGFLENRNLIGLYRGAKALVVSSFYESFGFPILEALACRTSVVATKGAVIPEFSNFVSSPSSATPEKLAQTILSVLNKKDREKNLAGFEKAKELNWLKAAKKLFKLINETSS